MPLPTRLRIIDFIRSHQTASVRELSRGLGMTGANIRHHLAVLEANDLIELVSRRREARGRPVNVYGLSRRVLGDGLDELSGALLIAWLGSAPDTVREAGLRSVAQHLVGQNPPRPDVVLSKRLTLLIDHLNELHYQARWEAASAGPRILLGHCPYGAIIETHPELCRIDRNLLEIWLGLSIEQTAKLEPSINGLPYCAFHAPANRD
jgi:predicted ArsR family transcriptional regulator